MIKCIIIDDEPLAVKLLSNYVNEHENLELTGAYHDPIKVLHEIDSLKIDLILLDVQMPQLSGIQFLKIINNKIPVILTTAYDEYALESYEYKVVDYLVKPISFDRFSKSIEKFKAYAFSQSGSLSLKGAQLDNQGSIFVKSGHQTKRINLSEVDFLESKGDYLHINVKEKVVKTLENLKDLHKRLTTNFLRCHRSFIVNMDKIDFIENNRIVIGESYIPISRAYAAEVQSYVNNKNDFNKE